MITHQSNTFQSTSHRPSKSILKKVVSDRSVSAPSLPALITTEDPIFTTPIHQDHSLNGKPKPVEETPSKSVSIWKSTTRMDLPTKTEPN